eukprot:GILK01001947.1.p1 GENE.GILK01001947.1~~GILK01001947.1.p1  ORF type:complete len:461 (-),score=109.45 GILK01001947.1:171-1496(-)
MADLFGSDSEQEAEQETSNSTKKNKSPRNNDSDQDDGSGSEKNRKVKSKMEDLFGSDSDDGSPVKKKNRDRSDDEDEPLATRETQPYSSWKSRERLMIEVPSLPRPNPQHELYYVKLPNVLSINSLPFDPESFTGEKVEEEYLDEEGAVRVKLKDVENVIRWRYARDAEDNLIHDAAGETQMESNARVVQWSDGSRQLFIGNEVLDLATTLTGGDNHHLYVRQAGLIQMHGMLTKKINFRPHNLMSTAHQRLKVAVKEKSKKGPKTVLTATVFDPEKEKEKLEEDWEASSRLRQRQRKKQDAYGISAGLTKNYLEKGEEDEVAYEGDLSAIKESFGIKKKKTSTRTAPKKRARESEQDEEERDRRLMKSKEDKPAPKRAKPVESEEEASARSSSEEEAEYSMDKFDAGPKEEKKRSRERKKRKKEESSSEESIEVDDEDDD